jgi:hypothetical protein
LRAVVRMASRCFLSIIFPYALYYRLK